MIASGEQQSGLLHSEAALYNQQLVAHHWLGALRCLVLPIAIILALLVPLLAGFATSDIPFRLRSLFLTPRAAVEVRTDLSNLLVRQ